MKKWSKRFISWLLVAVFLFQPFLPEIAARADDDLDYRGSVTNAQTEFAEAYDEIMAIQEVSLSGFTKAVLGGAGAIKDLFNGKEPNPEYNAKIEEANSKIRETKANAATIKAQMDGETMNDKDIDIKVYEMKKGLNAAAGEVGAQQNALIEAGNTLKNVARMLDGLGVLLTGVSVVLMALGIITFGTTSAIGTALDIAGIAVAAASNALNAVGDSLIASGESGKMDDASMSAEYAANGAKALLSTGFDVASQVGLGKIAKGLGVGEPIADMVDEIADCKILDEVFDGTKLAAKMGKVPISKAYGLFSDFVNVAAPDVPIIGEIPLTGEDIMKKMVTTSGDMIIDDMKDTPGLD